MKRELVCAVRCMLSCILLLALSAAAPALAQFERVGVIHPSLPEIVIRIEDAGETDDSLDRPNLLRVHVSAQDGSFSQELVYRSLERADADGAAALVTLRDVNFDGYQDLLLLAAQGARNVFHAVSLWDAEAGAFRPVMQGSSWSTADKAFSWESRQLELCNFELDEGSRRILSSVADGYRYRTEIVYEWEGRYGLAPKGVLDVYDAGEGMIGELLELHATGITRCWDEAYPEAWYYGSERVMEERTNAVRLLMMGSGAENPPRFMEVANVSWVNLRRQDSKDSPSLARLDKGTSVRVLADGCGEDNGWVRVWVPDEGPVDEANPGLTGYIWHSYLK